MKTQKNLKTGMLVSLMMAFILPAQAMAQDDFKEGMKSFRSGDYQSAVESFEKTLKQKQVSAALYYNLASSYYKLGDFKQAETYFNKVAEYPNMKSVAEYNLGLAARKQGKHDEATRWFESVVKNNDDKKLAALARDQIRRKDDYNQWGGFFRGGLGYDDNINIAPDEVAQTPSQSDTFYDLFVSVDYLLTGSRKDGWMAEGSFYNINYFDSSNYDETRYGVGAKKYGTLGGWDTRFSGRLDKLTYGGDDYQSIFGIHASGRKRLSSNERVQLRYRFEDIGSDNALYDYLDGWRQQMRAEYRFYGKDNNKRFYYELELNNRQDTANASYSPTRHTIRGIYTRKLDSKKRWNADVSYRSSSYDYPGASTDRDDSRLRLGFNMDYRLDKTMKLRGEVVHTNNNSNLSGFDYTRNIFRVNLSKLF